MTALSDDQRERRRLTVAEYFLVWEDSDDDSPSLRQQLQARRAELRETYLSLLHRVPVARCPYTDVVVERTIDDVDLDGLWWEARAPSRPPVEPAPATFIGVTGAVRLGEPVAWAPFLAKPGPEVPYVRPELLQIEGVVAVVSRVRIGPHTGYPVSYFLDPGRGAVPDELRVNEWGSERFRAQSPDGAWRWGSELDDENRFDYELGPWLERGALQWIEPDAGDFGLRTGVEGCPYLDLDGHRAVTRIEEGDVWWPGDEPT